MVAHRLIKIYAVEDAIKPYEDVLKAHKVLTCSYHDAENGIDSLGTGYWFWYKQAPPNWQEILDAVPKGCGFVRLGPPVDLAPGYVGEADRMLAEYRKSLGY